MRRQERSRRPLSKTAFAQLYEQRFDADFDACAAARPFLERELALARSGRAPLRAPRLEGRLQAVPGGHLHLHPELFLQVSGESVFRFPEDRIVLRAGQTLLVPRGLAHAETLRARGGPFYNLVIAISADGAGMHFAHLDPGRTEHRAAITGSRRVRSDRAGTAADYLEDLAQQWRAGGPGAADVVAGLYRAALGTLLDLVLRDDADDAEPRRHPKVEACRYLVSQRLSDPALSVRDLARTLRCSADYLSHLYRQETGETLTGYVNAERMRLAQR
ncbi:MAG: hypothetical protein ACOCX4_03785, partial [Planctomycetota bacterium]